MLSFPYLVHPRAVLSRALVLLLCFRERDRARLRLGVAPRVERFAREPAAHARLDIAHGVVLMAAAQRGATPLDRLLARLIGEARFGALAPAEDLACRVLLHVRLLDRLETNNNAEGGTTRGGRTVVLPPRGGPGRSHEAATRDRNEHVSMVTADLM